MIRYGLRRLLELFITARQLLKFLLSLLQFIEGNAEFMRHKAGNNP